MKAWIVFRRQIDHPHTWTEDLESKDKKVVVISSGDTAATLIPAMADDCKRIIQRSF